MEANPAPSANPANLPIGVYNRLGKKTLMIFLLGRVGPPFILLLASVGLFAIQGEPFLKQIPVPNASHYIGLAAWIVLALFALLFLLAFLIAWLTYATYKFSLAEDSLKITRGILDKEEIAIPYRQIQDVDIESPLSFRIMGVSRIIILTAGHEDQPGQGEPGERGESEGVLPALDTDLAESLQNELLKRADVQKVVEAGRTEENK